MTRTKPRVWALAKGAVACLLASCSGDGRGCTLVGYFDTVTFELSSPLSEAGVYSLTLSADGVERACSVTVAAAGAFTSDCKSLEISIGEPGAREVSWIQLLWSSDPEPPQSVSFSLLRDGDPLASIRVEPQYSFDEPNGDGCGTRAYATVPVAL